MFFARVWFTGVITRQASSRNYTCYGQQGIFLLLSLLQL